MASDMWSIMIPHQTKQDNTLSSQPRGLRISTRFSYDGRQHETQIMHEVGIALWLEESKIDNDYLLNLAQEI